MADNISAQGQVQTIQLNALSTASDAEILAELSTYETQRIDILKPSLGSTAISGDLKVFCRKQNDGTWLILR